MSSYATLYLRNPDYAGGRFARRNQQSPVALSVDADQRSAVASSWRAASSVEVHRLPELALLAGPVLSFLAATMPAMATGFWDRKPQRTPGRLRRALQGKPFPQFVPLPERTREKVAATDPLPKGILAHRHQPGPNVVACGP